MSYVKDNLVRDESVRYWSRMHWIQYVNFIVFAGFAGLLALTVMVINRAYGTGLQVLFWGFAPLSYPYLRQRFSELAVTNRRVIAKQGLLSRRVFELRHSKIESVCVDQGFVGKILGFGTVRIRGTGTSQEDFLCVADPLELRRHIDMVNDSLRPPAPEQRRQSVRPEIQPN